MNKDIVPEVRAEILRIGRAMLDRGLVAGTWGNVSTRINGSDWVAITPSGRDYRKLTANDIVIADSQGQVVDGGKPSSELPLHLAIYQRRRDIRAVVHTHSIFASAFAVARRSIPPVIEDQVMIVGGSVNVARYALPGTAELAKNAVDALEDRQAVLLANHGLVGCGKTLDEALLACELVEKASQIMIYASMLGEATVLAEEDVSVMRRFYLEHYRDRQGGKDE